LPNALKFLRQLERRLEELEKSLKPKSE
jgi:hypothetical protein